jgi:hypothetical protein
MSQIPTLLPDVFAQPQISNNLHEAVAMILTCVSCGLRQFVLHSDLCRRCHAPLGSSVFELSLVDNPLSTPKTKSAIVALWLGDPLDASPPRQDGGSACTICPSRT